MKGQSKRTNLFILMSQMASSLVMGGMDEHRANKRAKHIMVHNGGNGEYHCSPSKRNSYAAQNRMAKKRRKSR